MGEVFLDGEAVIFEGPPPESAQAVQIILSGVLESKDMCLGAFTVDGVDWLRDSGNDSGPDFRRIEAISVSQGEVFVQLIEQTLEKSENLPQEMENFARVVLNIPWSMVVVRLEEFSQKWHPITELMGHLVDYARNLRPPWRDEVEALYLEQETLFQEFYDYAKNGDVAEISNLTAGGLALLSSHAKEFVHGPTRRYFTEKA